MNRPEYKYPKVKKTKRGVGPIDAQGETALNIVSVSFQHNTKTPYFQLRNYKLSNIKYYIQGKWRAFIIRQYNKLNLPESSIFQRIVKYENYLGTCPHCGCPMSEILLTNKECDEK